MIKISLLWLTLTIVVVVVLSCTVSVVADTEAEEIQEYAVGIDGEYEDSNPCEDAEDDCEMWADSGECDANPYYMLYYCKISCDTCEKSDTELSAMAAEAQKRLDERTEEEQRLIANFGVEQELEDVPVPVMVKQWWEETKYYMESIVRVQERYETIKDDCLNRNKMCTVWAADGRCEDDPDYMETQCAPSCRTCHRLIFEERCPWDPTSVENAWEPGDLDKMFTRITTERYYLDKYEPQILSRPGGDPNNDPATVKDGPWMVVLNNFLSEDECHRLIQLGGIEGYELSKDVGERKPDGSYGDKASKYRTSTNAWCTGACYDDSTTQRVVHRMENITGIPDQYSEYFQLLRYEVGQFYGKHHDYSEHVKDRAEGVRILTVFFYLNDVEEGGGTDFPRMNITVMPRRGQALLWPSVLDEEPHEVDERTQHQALPVEKGVKYGCNAWVHMRDFKTPYDDGCAT